MGRCYEKSQLRILQSQLGIQTYQRILYYIPRKYFSFKSRGTGKQFVRKGQTSREVIP
jgi:hypothetical protein